VYEICYINKLALPYDPVLSPYSELKMLDHDNRHGLLIMKNVKMQNYVRVMFRGQKKLHQCKVLIMIVPPLCVCVCVCVYSIRVKSINCQ